MNIQIFGTKKDFDCKKAERLSKIAMFLSSGDPDMYDAARFSCRGDFLDYLGLEGKGIFTTCGYEPRVPENKLRDNNFPFLYICLCVKI